MKKIFLFTILITFVSITTIWSSSRVSFVRPGSLMRISNFQPYNDNTLFSLALGSEITSVGNITSHSSSFAYNKTNVQGSSWGVSYTTLPYVGTDANEAHGNINYEFGYHFQKNIYNTGTSIITAGVHDILLSQETININDISIFINFINTLSSSNYTLTSLVGIGSGRMAFDPHTDVASTATSLGLYLGVKLNTPFLKDWGGVDFITEIIHQGLNIGLVIPITQEYTLSLGITHIENLSDFSNQADELNPQDLLGDGPALSIGFGIDIPKINQTKNIKIAQEYPLLFINGQVDSSLFHAGEYIYYLQDSLAIVTQEINNTSSENIKLKLDNQNYQDSLNSLILQTNINHNTQNAAMRHLSKSLRLYYQGDFKQALQEVEKAIDLQPNIAVAYARKGSIYYKLNQLDRATLNWNIALKLDPEYSEVRKMLNALAENKLRPASTQK